MLDRTYKYVLYSKPLIKQGIPNITNQNIDFARK